MHSDFLKVLKLSMRYKWSLVGSFICSGFVALLWSANIGAVYPVARIVFYGKTIQESVSEQIDELEEKISNCEQDLGSSTDAESQQSINASRLDSLRSELQQRRTLHDWAVFLPDQPFTTLVCVVVAFFIGTILKGLFLACNDLLVSSVVQRTLYDLRIKVFKQLMHSDMLLFEKQGPSKLLARFTHDLENVTGGLGVVFGPAIREPLKAIACLIGAAFVSWKLLLISLTISPFLVIAMRFVMNRASALNNDSMSAMSMVYTRLKEAFSGILVIKAFTLEREMTLQFQKTCSDIKRKVLRTQSFRAFLKPLSETFGSAAISIALLVGGYCVLSPDTFLSINLDPPSLMVFFGLLVGAVDPLRKLTSIVFPFRRSLVAAERVFSIIERQQKVADQSHPTDLGEKIREIAFDNVRFGYTPQKKVLRRVTANFCLGEVTAIVGPNGAGKTSLIKLLLRLYDAKSGCIRFNGIDIKNIRAVDLRSRIGIVTQTTFLFDGTVLENIRWGRPGATDAEVIHAAELAGAHEFITTDLEDGYDTIVGEECQRVSGGQAQRLALARAVLRDPDILILDEATSNMDAKAERQISASLRTFMTDRITLIIAHRQSTLRLARRILVLRDGKVVDFGTSDELSARCTLFERMFPSKH